MTTPAPALALIWAMGRNRIIGANNSLPWRLPADMKRFRRLTTGHVLLMGRKTYESLPAPLVNRTHVIITSERDYRSAPDCVVATSIPAALTVADQASQRLGREQVFVIGGASLYAQTLPLATRLYLTLIHAEFEGDTQFPEFDWNAWREVEHASHNADADNPYSYSFITLEKKPDTPL